MRRVCGLGHETGMASGFQSVVIDDHAACAGALAGFFRSPVCRRSVQVYRGCDAPNQRTRRPRFRQHQLQRSCCVQQPKPRVLTSKIHHQPWRVRRRIPHRARIGRHRFADCSVRSRLNFNDSGDEQQQQSQPEPQAKGGASADGSSSGNAQPSGVVIRTFYSQNCRGIKTDARLAELLDCLARVQAFVAFLQETWRTGQEQFVQDGWTFLGSAPDVQQGRGSAGVAIALSPHATAAWKAANCEWHASGPRVIAARLLALDPSSGRTVGIFTI